MGLVLNEDETMLRDSTQGYFADKAPVAALRQLRDTQDAVGFDRQLWSDMGEMGFAGVLVDEEHGGVDMGFMAAGLIAEQKGANLTASPFFSTSVLAASTLRTAGNQAQRDTYLPRIAGADIVMALAVDEGNKHNPDAMQTRAEKSGNGFKLNGHKAMVVDGHIADQIIVAAKTSDDGISLFLVNPDTPGLSIERTLMVDYHNAARLELDDVEVDGDALIGALDGGGDTLAHVLNVGRAIASAELLGASAQAFGNTLDYIKERKQFGKIIGEFQALQHRAAEMYTEMELARSCVYAALSALDSDQPDVPTICAMTKAKLGEVAKRVGLEGIQMHGGVGMTDEYDIGLYLKRIRVLQELLGDEHYHAHRLARAKGF